MILVTGASGKTGKSIVKKLAENGIPVRAMVRTSTQMEEMRKLGAKEAGIADMKDGISVNSIFKGVEKVYHICPNMSPDEESIGDLMIRAAQENGLSQFVYHSVLHPQVESMPHHWKKMHVEEKLMKSKLVFTILQPAAYMQNILGYWDKMMQGGVYEIPYSTRSQSSMIDLKDLAEVVFKVMTEPDHYYATYELCGCEQLSADQIAEIVSQKSGKKVVARDLDRNTWEIEMRSKNMAEYARETLLKMFQYYEQFDFIGNCNQLTWLLGRSPNTFGNFIEEFILENKIWE
ncbi:MAG: nucleoside-diphosphate sugar epimerase [Chloroflexi bacterium HGW-Chloroflexi-8]|nr:MAG: nucleoside-diphosphate sugar epimerase [Chloroflexi bacterium HGW-Chloroflexi-8]